MYNNMSGYMSDISSSDDEEPHIMAEFAIQSWPPFYRSPYFKISMDLVAEFNSAIQSISDISGSDEGYKNYLVGSIQRIISNCNADTAAGFKLCLYECFDFLIEQCNEKINDKTKQQNYHRNQFLTDIRLGLENTKQKVMRDMLVYFEPMPAADASTGSRSAYSDARSSVSTYVPNNFPPFARTPPRRGGKINRQKTRKNKI